MHSYMGPKIADRPHVWTLVFSAAALVFSLVSVGISIASWYESHRSRLLNENSSRPVVRVVGAKTAKTWNGSDDLEVIVTVTNLGRTIAERVSIGAFLELGRAAARSHYWFGAPGTSWTGDLAPGATQTIKAVVHPFSTELTRHGETGGVARAILSGFVSYTDPTNHAPYDEPWCLTYELQEHKNSGTAFPIAFSECSE